MTEATDGGGASRSTDPASGSSSATDVSLREFVGLQIGYERHGTLTIFASLVAIATFAWAEIQRRLTNLNHENARILAAQAASVSADTYAANEKQRDATIKEVAEWRKDVDRDRNNAVSREEFTRDTKTERRGSVDTGTRLVGVAVAVIALVGTAVLVVLAILTYRVAVRPTTTSPASTVTVTVPAG